ncbi:MAG TPA: hypothetical protein VMK66_07430, partial [Myxococcales bacterium]|nr:hypothetical protein [Myxococcales bacterium]
EVQPRPAAELRDLAEAVRKMISEEIGFSPSEVCLLKPGALARTSSGKLMRRDARDRYLEGALSRSQALRAVLPLRLVDAARGAVMRFVARRRLSQG